VNDDYIPPSFRDMPAAPVSDRYRLWLSSALMLSLATITLSVVVIIITNAREKNREEEFASTLTSRACPTGSSCNTLYLGGMCQKTCDQTVASTCRGNTLDKKGDYECIAWNNLSISTAPVCDFGMNLACSFLQTTSGTLSCANLGTDKTAATNPTNMTCRKPDGTVLTNKWDPAGYCYDNTASGN